MAIDSLEQNDVDQHHANHHHSNSNNNNNNNHRAAAITIKNQQYQQRLAHANGHHQLDNTKIDIIYADLRKEFKSKPQKEKDAICKIRFINCTSRRVVIFWIDFDGCLKEYTTFSRGDFYDVNTFVSHLWLFRSSDNDKHQPVQVLAVPEDSLIEYQREDREVPANGLPWTISNVRCHNCVQLPLGQRCPHLTGEAKFSSADTFPSTPNYIYKCSKKSHHHEHNCHRRNIYLVETFLNLRERCFIAIKNKIKRNSDIFNMEIPASLKREYFEFVVLPEETHRKK